MNFPRKLLVPPLAIRTALLASATVVLLLLNAHPAAAVVTEVGSGAEAVTVGLQPRDGEQVYDGDRNSVASFENETGRPVMPVANTYAIYWDPTDHYHGDWQQLIDGFFQNVGAASGSFANVFSVDTQYTDEHNQHAAGSFIFRGAYTDTDVYPHAGCTDPAPMRPGDAITCLTDQQIRQELQEFIAQHDLQKGMSSIFYVLTPPGVTVCLDEGGMMGHCSDGEEAPSTSYSNSFCSYHAAITPTNPSTGDENTVIYGVIPWMAGGAGDYQLDPLDRTEAYQCQDGGFNPDSEPIEQREKKKEKTTKEEEEFKEKTLEEQQEQLLAEELEGPHVQEPNQPTSNGPDGGFDTGLADLIVGQITAEQQDIVTNPLLNAWQDSKKLEATDECRNFFASTAIGGGAAASKHSGAGTLYNQIINGSDYYVNDAFNLSALRLPYPAVPCIPGIRLEPQFTAPNSVNTGELVDFDGMESDITLNAGTFYPPIGSPKKLYANYKWNFGDGTPEVSGYAPGATTTNPPETSPCAAPWETPCAASTFHSYQYGGTYQVTLTATDAGAHTVSITHPITVIGPPPPSSGGNPGTSAGGSGNAGAANSSPTTGSSSSSNKSSGGSSNTTLPAPTITAFVPSKGLKKATQKGLRVTYTVNEQVAGSIQVLLESTVAKRLGISGPLAVGLPKGTPRSIVIGTAVLVTTKAGKGTIHIKLSARAANALVGVSKVKVMLRLIARNASRQRPLSTTLLSTFVLKG